ncbi:hypothetical protein Ccrd_020360 [Cynara cardunculus var. scolymus]|uniref:Uncharacterized protein n=1 Tax=Cynara cardunculus var. scolymus TaxID=59895 RepID=A0A103Y2L3_CYNCS|nr:hypothetical protein Ccrd_020360 [Cynara cardunculus var. scolymus]
MPEKNAVTWNAMISGYGLHGRAHEPRWIGERRRKDFYAVVQDRGSNPYLSITPAWLTFLVELEKHKKLSTSSRKCPLSLVPLLGFYHGN